MSNLPLTSIKMGPDLSAHVAIFVIATGALLPICLLF